MSEAATTKAIRSLQTQLRDEKTAHAVTRNNLQAEIARIWRLDPGHYIPLMGAYPPLRKLLHVLAEAADLQDPSRGAPIEDTMRTQFVHVGEHASTSATEAAVSTHRHQRAVVAEMLKELDWMTHKLSKLIPGTDTEYHPPDGECPECGRFIFQSEVGRNKTYCSARCRLRALRGETKRNETVDALNPR